jgi:hypothetical protein
MGQYLSALNHKNNENNINETNLCYICRKIIHKDELVNCVVCKANIHVKCEDVYRHNRNYSKCPKCGNVGTLGSIWSY